MRTLAALVAQLGVVRTIEPDIHPDDRDFFAVDAKAGGSASVPFG